MVLKAGSLPIEGEAAGTLAYPCKVSHAPLVEERVGVLRVGEVKGVVGAVEVLPHPDPALARTALLGVTPLPREGESLP